MSRKNYLKEIKTPCYRFRLKELAAKKRIKLSEIAEATGLSRSIIYNIASNPNYDPKFGYVLVIARYLGVSLDEFIEVEEEKEIEG